MKKIWNFITTLFKKKVVVILDLDYTLLDTKKLKQSISMTVCGNTNMTAQKIVEAFNDLETKPEIEKVLKKSLNFIYPSVECQLLKLKKETKLILLSKRGKVFGAASFQNKKITPLQHLFDDIIIVNSSEDKNKVVAGIMNDNPKKDFYFINDNPVENEKISTTFGYNLKVIAVKNHENQDGEGAPINSVLERLIYICSCDNWHIIAQFFYKK